MTPSRLAAWLCLAPVAVRLHEHAHAFVARRFGWRARVVVPDRLALDDWGARFEYATDAATWPQHVAVAIAGPAASLAWALAVAAAYLAAPWPPGLALLPALLFSLRALGGCVSDVTAARRAVGCALADALGEEVDGSVAGLTLAAWRLARRRASAP